MGRHRQPRMHTPTCSLCRSYKHGHTHACTHPMQRACGPCVDSTHSGVACLLDTRERERDGVCDFPFLALFFLPLTVRWMIAITGAISETEWRTMGQRDTAMGNQPSDYCTALPWEHCCLFVKGFCCFLCFFLSLFPFSVWPFDVQNMKASS